MRQLHRLDPGSLLAVGDGLRLITFGGKHCI